MTSYSYLPSVSSTNSTSTTAPSWAPQVGALTTAFGGATDAYNQQKAMGLYNGDYVAAPNQTQYDAYNQAAQFGGANGGVGQNQVNTGQGLLNNYGVSQNALNGMYNFGSQDQTQNNINTANQYAQNPYIDQAVKAATYSANRNAAENDLPNLYRSASASGNLNSDRTALAQGVVDRSLSENAQNIDASLRNSAWQNGLGTALNQNTQSQGALGNAMSGGATLGAQGSGMMSQGINDQTNLSNLYSTAGSGLNALQQSILNNNLAKYQGNIANMWSPVQNLYGIAGANNWGSTQNTNGTTTSFGPVANQQSPGALSYLGAGLGMAGSIAGTAVGGPAGGTLGGMAAGALGKGISNFASTGSLFPKFGSYGPQPAY